MPMAMRMPAGQPSFLTDLANGDSVVVFRIDPESGKLTPTGHSVKVPAPVCLRFAPKRP